MFDALLKSRGNREKSADDALNANMSYRSDKSSFNNNQFEEKVEELMGEDRNKRAVFEEKYSLIGKTYGTSTFETFARDGSTKYQDLWLKNPRDPFAVTSVHSMSQSIPEKLEKQNLKIRLSSCMNLSKKTSNLYNNILNETEDGSLKRFDSLSNHASASSSQNKLSDISTPRQSFEHLKGDGKSSECYSRYDLDKPKTSDVPYPSNSNVITRVKHGFPENIPGNKLFFKSVKRTNDMDKTLDCLEQIKKCLHDLNI